MQNDPFVCRISNLSANGYKPAAQQRKVRTRLILQLNSRAAGAAVLHHGNGGSAALRTETGQACWRVLLISRPVGGASPEESDNPADDSPAEEQIDEEDAREVAFVSSDNRRQKIESGYQQKAEHERPPAASYLDYANRPGDVPWRSRLVRAACIISFAESSASPAQSRGRCFPLRCGPLAYRRRSCGRRSFSGDRRGPDSRTRLHLSWWE